MLSAAVIGWLVPPKETPNRKSFQILVNCQMTETTVIGPETGSRMRQKMRKKPAPSICAALDQFGREGGVVVAVIERGEADAIDHMDQDQSGNRAGKPELSKHQRHRDQHDLKRNEAGKQHQTEDDRVAAKAPFGEHVAVERAEDRRDATAGTTIRIEFRK